MCISLYKVDWWILSLPVNMIIAFIALWVVKKWVSLTTLSVLFVISFTIYLMYFPCHTSWNESCLYWLVVPQPRYRINKVFPVIENLEWQHRLFTYRIGWKVHLCLVLLSVWNVDWERTFDNKHLHNCGVLWILWYNILSVATVFLKFSTLAHHYSPGFLEGSVILGGIGLNY